MPWLFTKKNYPQEEEGIIKAPVNFGTFFPQIKPAIKKLEKLFGNQLTEEEQSIFKLLYAQLNQSIGTGAYRFLYYNLLVIINALNKPEATSEKSVNLFAKASKQYAIDTVYALAIQIAWATYLFEEYIQYFVPYKKDYDGLFQLITLENKYRPILDNKKMEEYIAAQPINEEIFIML